MKYFGVNIRNKKDGMNLTKDNYIRELDRDLTSKAARYVNLTEELIETLETRFDMLKYTMQRLDNKDFNKSVDAFTRIWGFKEITDLNTVADKEGYYLMVLDEYNAMYIGVSTNVRKRILAHWSRAVPVDILVSYLRHQYYFIVDCFRALDTTRIFFLESDNQFYEHIMMGHIPVEYCLNVATGNRYVPSFPMFDSMERDRRRREFFDDKGLYAEVLNLETSTET